MYKKDTDFFVGINAAELSIETAERVYSYRIYADGIVISYVNNSPVQTMPTTPKTRKLNAVLARIELWAIELMNAQPPEKKRIYEKIGDHLT